MKRFSKTAVFAGVIFIVMVAVASCGAMTTKPQNRKAENSMHTWTVAKVIDDKNNDFIKVVFLESARFYKLMRNKADFNKELSILKKAEKGNSAVKVRFAEPHGDIIKDVE
jgi:hypothetical protein